MFGVDLSQHTHQQTLSESGSIDGHLMKPKVRWENDGFSHVFFSKGDQLELLLSLFLCNYVALHMNWPETVHSVCCVLCVYVCVWGG